MEKHLGRQKLDKVKRKSSLLSPWNAAKLTIAMAFLAGCEPVINQATKEIIPATATPAALITSTPFISTDTLTPSSTKEPTETLNPYALFSPFEKSSFSPEMQTYIADLPGRQVAETGSTQEDDYIKEDQAFHLYYTQGLIDYLGKEGVDVSSFKSTDLLVYNNSIKVYEALWKQMAKNPESYDTKWIPTPWLLRGDGKTNLGMYDPANFIVLPSDKQGPGKYTLRYDYPFTSQNLIEYYHANNWEQAKQLWYQGLTAKSTIPLFGLDKFKPFFKAETTYGVITALADHPGYPDGSVKIVFMGFQDDNGKWVYQPFAVNLGKNKTKSSDYVSDGYNKVFQLSKDQAGYLIPIVGSNFPTTPSRKEYTLANLIKMIDHQVYGTPYNGFGLFPLNHYVLIDQYFFGGTKLSGGIESFCVIFDGGKAAVSPLSSAVATPSQTPTP
jgi:hypothetical protein